jgi:hypothetical protein
MAAGAQEYAESEGLRGAELLARGKHAETAEQIVTEAKRDGDRANAINAIRATALMVQTCAKLTGEIDDSVHVNLAIAPKVTAIQSFLTRLCDKRTRRCAPTSWPGCSPGGLHRCWKVGRNEKLAAGGKSKWNAGKRS